MKNLTELMHNAKNVCNFLDVVDIENSQRETKYKERQPISLNDVICG